VPALATEIPRNAPPSSLTPVIPSGDDWGLYVYLENVDDSLVEAHTGVLSAESGESPSVLYFRELRTPLSKALAAALAIAAADLLETEILDLEHVWSNRAQIAPSELEQRLTIPESQPDIQLAAARLLQKMYQK
jgi:hypothetical protein